MLKVLFCLIFILLLSLSSIFSASWTVLVFINADNNLNDAGQADVDEMESSGGSTNDVNIVIQIDGSSFYGGYYDKYGNHTTTRRYYITNNTQNNRIDSDFLQDIGEADMGNPNTLAAFVNWGINNYPADHYAVVAWDHGGGWTRADPLKDFSNDYQSGNGISIANGEWESALSSIKSNLGRNIDLWGFDACLMGMMEVEYVGKNYIDVLCHSEETEPFDGWPYDDWLPGLLSNPNWTPRELATRITNDYVASYTSSYTPTFSSVDLDPTYTTLTLAVDDFSRELIKAGGKSNAKISTARNNSQEYYISTYIDLYDFANEVKTQNINASLNNAAQAVLDAIGYPPPVSGKPLVEEGHKGNGVKDSHGISIYYPKGSPDGSYSGLPFADNNAWWPFIQGNSSLPSAPIITYNSHTFTDYGNGNGIPDPGEDVEMSVLLRNSGGVIATNVNATLSCDNPLITLGTTSQNYPNINSESTSQSSGAYSFSVALDAVSGERVVFQLNISAKYTAKANYSNTTTFNWVIGDNPVVITLSSLTAISSQDGIHLKWRTESEVGAFRFLIKRGTENNVDDAKLTGDVLANGNSNKPNDYEFLDNTTEENIKYYYWLVELLNNGGKKTFGPVIGYRNVSTTAQFAKSYPEPFGKEVTMNYVMNRKGFVKLEIYDISGRIVKTLLNNWSEPGNYSVIWDGRDNSNRRVTKGIYFYIFRTNEYSKKGKITFIK